MSNDPAGQVACRFPIFDHRCAVYQDPGNPNRSLDGVFKGGLCSNGFWIEDDEICGFALGEFTSVWNPESPGGETAHFVNGFFKRDELMLPNKEAEYAGEAPTSPWMGMRDVEDAVAGDHHSGVCCGSPDSCLCNFGVYLPGEYKCLVFLFF